MRERLTLTNICQGELQDRVDRELEKIVRNIMDPDMNPKKPRVLTMKIFFVPDEHYPAEVKIAASVESKLAPEKPAMTNIVIQNGAGGTTMREFKDGEVMGQLDFEDIGFALPDEGPEGQEG